jgi:uncharacterized protein YodC (DUF2158 family)
MALKFSGRRPGETFPEEQASKTMEFQPGEIVQLKSGGRSLTVVRQLKQDVDVIWYADTDDNLRTATIPAACLALIEFADEDDLDDE